MSLIRTLSMGILIVALLAVSSAAGQPVAVAFNPVEAGSLPEQPANNAIEKSRVSVGSAPLEMPVGDGARIYLAAGDFDPLQTPVLPGLPARWSSLSAEAASDGYWLVQFDRPITASDRTQLETAGCQVLDYLPDFTFLVQSGGNCLTAADKSPGRTALELATASGLTNLRWVGAYLPAYRVAPALLDDALAERSEALDLTVATFRGADHAGVAVQIERLGGQVLSSSQTTWKGKLKVRISAAQIEALAYLAGVQWIEPSPHWRLFNNEAGGLMGVRPVWNTHGLYGAGQIVAVADTGLDQGSAAPDKLHDDFEDGNGQSRVLHIFDRVGDGAQDTQSGHGTHVSGSVLGNGALSGSQPATHTYPAGAYAGIAPEASLVFQSVENNQSQELSGIPDDLNDLYEQAYNAGARIHTSSWGETAAGIYNTFAQDVDEFTWNFKDFLVLFSAGNDGIDNNADGVVDTTSTGTPSTAKNAIAVGASENQRASQSATWGGWWPAKYPSDPLKNDRMANASQGLAAFSSRGPTLDGRYKPDIVAPGTFVASTRSSIASGDGWGHLNANYVFMGGTSMAAPLTAGAAALVREYYTRTGALSPSAALVKATLLHGATDIYPGQYGSASTQEITPTRPNNVEGWGLVNVENSLYPAGRRWFYVDQASGLNTGSMHAYTARVTNTAQPLRATLAWSDYPGSLAASGGLVNDLDLHIVGPDGDVYTPDNAVQRAASQALFYDDGVPAYSYALKTGQRAAVYFTPTSYPARLDQGVVYVYAISYPTRFLLKVWDDNGLAGRPGALLFSTPVTARSEGWLAVPVANVMISSGGFYLGLEITSDSPPQPRTDEESSNTRSWYYDGSNWSLWADSPGYAEDLAMRAIVTTGSSSGRQDRVNPIEGIELPKPAKGLYSIVVSAYNVPQGPQPYALVVSGASDQSGQAALPPAQVTLSGPISGLVQSGIHFTATVTPATTTLPITYTWQASNQATVAHVGGLSDTAVFTWSVAGRQMVTVTAANLTGTVSSTHAITIATPPPQPLSSLELDGPTAGLISATYTFTARVSPPQATQPITYIWQSGEHMPVMHTGGLSDTAAFTWSVAAAQPMTLTAINAANAITTVYTFHVTAQPRPLAGVTINGPAQGQVNQANTFTATISPVTATQPVTYRWQAIDQAAVTHTGYGRDEVTFIWHSPGRRVVTLTASNVANAVTATQAIVINDSGVPLPGVTISGPAEGLVRTYYTFTANIGPITAPLTALLPITYTWSASDQAAVTRTGGISNVISWKWSTAGSKTITVVAANPRNVVTGVWHFQVRPYRIYLPLMLIRWPALPYQPSLATIENSDDNGDYTLSWSEQPQRRAITYTVQEATDAGFTSNLRVACSQTDPQTCSVTGNLAGTYYYRVRGRNEYGYSAWSNAQTATVLPPGTPTLDPIDNADGNGDYRITWNTTARANSYVLQEDDQANFSSPQIVYGPGANTFFDVSGRTGGPYYYRVQAKGPTGNSVWSNVQSAAIYRTANDPNYSLQWGLSKINAHQAWSASTGASMVVAILDTGVDLDHPDLAGKVIAGWDFANNDSTPQDDNGHGSHAAGIAAAMTNNSVGIAGIGWDTQIMPIKVLDNEGSGWSSDIASGIEWAVNHNARVLNLSLGSQNQSSTMLDATNYAFDHGALVVAAAGNCGDPATYMYNGCTVHNPTIYPAANENVLAVGSTTSNDSRSSFSEYGWFVDVSAPGSSIYSTVWDNDYEYKSGTSMASPLVAGLVTLVWGRNTALSNAQAAAIIMNTAKDLGTAGRDNQYGYGRVDAGAAVAAALSNAQYAIEPVTADYEAVADSTPASGAEIRAGVLLVRFKPGALENQRQSILQRFDLQATGQIEGIGVTILAAPAGRELELAAQLAGEPGVEFAEPDYRVYLIE